LRLDPHLVEAHEGVGHLYVALGNLHAAEHHFHEALRYEPHHVNAHIGLATVQRHYGQFEKALSTISEAQDNPDTIAIKADIMQRMGNEEGAYELLSDLNERQQMPPVGVDAFTRICRTFDVCDDALELIELSVESPGTNAMQKQMLRYAAGGLLDKLQRYEEAFEWFRAANETETIPFKAEEQQKLTDRLISYFSKEAMAKLPRAVTGSTRPIFILGMPRSGTTLTEQILASHPHVYGAGELVFINDRIREIRNMPPGSGDFWAAHMDKLTEEKMTELANHYLGDIGNLDSEAKHVTDKMPHNFLAIGLINLLLPEARIIHCRRNPLDTGLSIYFQSFLWLHNYATDLADIGCFYNEYHRLMQHWEQVIDIPMLNVDYEDMIEDTEGVSRKILEFCQLEWHDSVMDFYKSGRAVATSSYDQVRQPIYKTSRARWKNYEQHIEPLRKALSEHSLDDIWAG
ncbi:MAG TPA: sulfotransferase family protein, partial [Gammaproteobacteria bacterium]|nr:sulfotransferase family protein [Gammaproteobacteria bacterium]